MNGKCKWILVTVLLLQATTGFAQVGCYQTFLDKGDRAFKNKQYQNAIKLYQAAKMCDTISYNSLTVLENRISRTYEQWVRELDNAKRQSDKAAADALVSLVSKAFLEQDYKQVNELFARSPVKNDPSVAGYRAELKPFIPDICLTDIKGFDTITVGGKLMLAVLEVRPGPEKDRSKKLARYTGDLDAGDTARLNFLDINVGNPGTVFSVWSEVTKSSESVATVDSFPYGSTDPYETEYAYRTPTTYNDYGYGVSIRREGDSLFLYTGDAKLYFNPLTKTLDRPTPKNNVNQKIIQEKELDLLTGRLLEKGLDIGMTQVIDSGQRRSKISLAITNTANSQTLLNLKVVTAVRYIDSLRLLVVATYNETNKTTNLDIYSVPTLAPVYSKQKITGRSNLYLFDESLVIGLTAVDENSKFDSVNYYWYAKKKQIFYDLVKKKEMVQDETIRISNITRAGDYYVAGDYTNIAVLDENGSERKNFSAYDIRYRFDRASGKLLVVKPGKRIEDYNTPYSESKKKEKLPVDTLIVYSVNPGHAGEKTYTGMDVKILNDSLVSLVEDANVKIFNFSKPADKEIVFTRSMASATVKDIGNYLWIKEDDKDNANTVIYSIKHQKELVNPGKVLSTEPGLRFFCATDNPALVAYCEIDSQANTVLVKTLSVSKEEAIKGIPYYDAGNDLIYTEVFHDKDESEMDDPETGTILNMLTRDYKKLLQLLTGSTITVHPLKTTKTRTIKSVGMIFDDNQMILAGRFIILKGFGSLFNEGNTRQCLLFNITK